MIEKASAAVLERIAVTREDVERLAGVEFVGAERWRPCPRASIDSRTIERGDLFVAINGERFDGADYAKDAIAKGATAIVAERASAGKLSGIDAPVALVEDATKAYGELANARRKKLNADVFSLTGSVGKTSVKEMTRALLGVRRNVVATAANNNNHIGVPLTVFEADETTEALVLEHGANHFGEIAHTAAVAEPDFALVTNVGSSHLEFFKDERGVLKEKRALLDAAIAAGGKTLVNLDDPWLAPLAKERPNATTFGEREDADVRLTLAELTPEGMPRVALEYQGERFETTLPVFGLHNAKNFLAAASFALLAGMSFEDIREGAATLSPTKGRLVLERIGDFAIVDDAYNANPSSMRAAFALVARMEGYRRRIAILGDMFELGERSEAMHRDLLAPLRDAGFDEALVLGEDMKTLADSANDARVRWAANREEMNDAIDALDLRGAIVLVKGSRGMRMEDFVPALKRRRDALSSL